MCVCVLQQYTSGAGNTKDNSDISLIQILNASVAISKEEMYAVRVCSNKIFQFLTVGAG